MVPDYLSAAPDTEMSPLRRWWRIWRAQVSGRVA
jgi:hypothetical protein